MKVTLVVRVPTNEEVLSGIKRNYYSIFLLTMIVYIYHEILNLSTGSKWKKRRRLLTPAFHYGILEDFAEVFQEQAKIFVDVLQVSLSYFLSPKVARWMLHSMACQVTLSHETGKVIPVIDMITMIAKVLIFTLYTSSDAFY